MKNQRMADVPIGTSRSQAVRWHLSLLLSHHGSAHYPLADCGHTTDGGDNTERGWTGKYRTACCALWSTRNTRASAPVACLSHAAASGRAAATRPGDESSAPLARPLTRGRRPRERCPHRPAGRGTRAVSEIRGQRPAQPARLRGSRGTAARAAGGRRAPQASS